MKLKDWSGFVSSRVGQRGVVFHVIINLKERVVKRVKLLLGCVWCLIVTCIAGSNKVVFRMHKLSIAIAVPKKFETQGHLASHC